MLHRLCSIHLLFLLLELETLIEGTDAGDDDVDANVLLQRPIQVGQVKAERNFLLQSREVHSHRIPNVEELNGNSRKLTQASLQREQQYMQANGSDAVTGRDVDVDFDDNVHVDVESVFEESLALSTTMQQIAARLPEGPTKDLLKSFQICTSCNSYIRAGEEHDGGYLTCLDNLQGSQVKAAYSLGVEAHDQWSLDIYKVTQMPIHQFDCTVDDPAQPCPACDFNKICLKGASGEGGYPGGPNMDLSEILTLTGQSAAPRASLLMKMDIEGSEWPILADGGADLTKFEQVIVEFHWLNQTDKHAQYAQAMKNLLDAGFSLWHLHGNNYNGMYTVAEYSIPKVLEATFLLEGQALKTCLTGQEYSDGDRANNASAPELPMANVPPS